MDEQLQQRLGEMQDQIMALQQLLLAHVLAVDSLDRDLAEAALDIAQGQVDAFRQQGRQRAALRLALLMQALADARADAPCN